MATQNLVPLQVAYTLSGGPAPVVSLLEATSQTFKKGELVYLASGYVTVCSTDPSLIIGIANEDAHNITAGTQRVSVTLLNGVVFKANVYHATAASAVTAQTQVGSSYGVVAVSNKWFVDISEESSKRVTIMDLVQEDTVGDTYGRVYFQIANAYNMFNIVT